MKSMYKGLVNKNILLIYFRDTNTWIKDKAYKWHFCKEFYTKIKEILKDKNNNQQKMNTNNTR